MGHSTTPVDNSRLIEELERRMIHAELNNVMVVLSVAEVQLIIAQLKQIEDIYNQ